MAANLPLFEPLPYYGIGAGISTTIGTMVPPGSRVNFVRSTGVQSGDPPSIAERLLPTLSAALSECRSGLNDYIFVLPGHQENVTGATFLSGLVANTQIIGLCDPKASNAPVFNWTNTAGNWAINVNNVRISGLKLSCDGANGITSAVTVTGAGCTMDNNYIVWASGAALKSTIGITVGSGATDFGFIANYVTGTATHNVTDGIKVLGGTVPTRLRIEGNNMIASATAGNGLVHVTVAALNVTIRNNLIYNTHTSSTAAITFDNVAADGMCCDNYVGVKATGAHTSGTTGIAIGAGALVAFFNNFSVNDPLKSGLLMPVVDT